MNKSEFLRLNKSVSVAGVKEGEKVLDLGCGNNMLRCFLVSTDYTGVDMVGGGIVYNLEYGLPNSIKNIKFDIIFMNEFIEHIENFKSLLNECKEVLTENGRIIISTPSNNRLLSGDFLDVHSEDMGHIHCFRKTNMRNLAKVCGLVITAIVGTYVRVPPFIPKYLVIPTNQTLYTEVIIYRLEKK